MLKMVKTFRKNQKIILAALVILAMFAFVFPFDSFFGNSGQRQMRKVTVDDNIFGREVTNEDLDRVRFDRYIANQFVLHSILTVSPQYASFLSNYEHFGSTKDEVDLKDAIRLDHKADEFGIRVSDEMVRGWIKRVTENKLSTEQFQEVVKKVGRQSDGITADTLFEILRHQLRIQHVRDLAMGRFPGGATQATPYEAWQFYRRLNDKLGLEVMAVSVSDFAAEIPVPRAEELRQLFNKYADRLPDPSSPEPGFKEPRKVNLQFASVSLDAFALAFKSEFEVTDDEIKQYYESRKELYRVPSRTEPPTPAPAEVPEKPKIESPKPEEPKDDAQKNKSEAPQEPKDAQKPTEKVEPKEQPASRPQEAGKDAASEDGKSSAKTEQKTEPETAKSEGVEGESTKKEEPPQYKPLEEVASEIRDILAKDKARAEIIKRLELITKAVNQHGIKYSIAKDKFEEEKEQDPGLQFVAPEPPDFPKIVEELGLKFAETGLVSVNEELSNVAGLGDALEMAGGRVTGRSVVEVMKTKTTDLYDPLEFKSFKDEYFAVWKIVDNPEKNPPFDEVREKVLATFRAIKARPLARERAAKLADSIREAGGDLAKLREQQPELKSVTIAPLSLWSNTPVFSMSMMGRPGRVQPAELPGLRFPGDEFRSNTFKLKEGEVTVAPNKPEDTYYVILLTKREHASLENFARSRTMIEDQVGSEQTQKIESQWLSELRRESASRKTKAAAGN